MLFGSEQSSSQVVVGVPTGKHEVITDETLEEIEHKYPFQTQIKGDNFSINTMPVRVSMKRPSEFDDPHKFSKGQVKAINTGIDLPYTLNRGSRAKTQGMFATDPQRAAINRNEGEQSRKGRIELLKRNQRMKDYLDK